MTTNGKALLSGFEFEKQKYMKELQELIKDLQLQMNYCCYDAEMLNKLSGVWEVVHKLVDLSQNLQQCNVSGALPPVDNRVMFADYIQRCVIERGQMTYPSLKDAIKAWDETTERFGGNDRKRQH